MRVVSEAYKETIRGPRQIDAKLNAGSIELTSSDLNSIKYSFICDLFKTVMKETTIDSNIDVGNDTGIIPKFALYVNDEFEWISLDKFKTISSKKKEDTESFEIKAYDKIIDSMVPYDLVAEFPMSVREYWIAIFNKLNWPTTGIPATFPNSTKELDKDYYIGLDKYTYRTVLDELCTVCGVWLVDKGGIPTIITTPNPTNQIIDETYLNENDVTLQKKVYFNSLVFARAEDSDCIYRKNDDDIEINGLNELKISDNQLLSTNNRDMFIDELWEVVQNFSYYSFDCKTTGISFLEPLDAFTIKIGDNLYPTLLLQDEITLTEDIEERILGPEPPETSTKYQYADETDRRESQTYILVKKQEQEIEMLTSKVDDTQEQVSSFNIKTDSITQTVSDTKRELEGKISGATDDIETLKITSTELQQLASSLSININNINQNGVNRVITTTGYRFDENGLDISKTGTEMHNLITNLGMYVKRDEEEVLGADKDGVRAENITVRVYLNIGKNSRLEDYMGNQTGLFFTGDD